MSFTPVATLDDLWLGEMLPVEVHGVSVLLVHTEAGVRAYQDRCTHQAVPLSQGTLEGDVLTCYAHHWCFDVRSGEGINPRRACLRRYPVEVRGEQIYVDVEIP